MIILDNKFAKVSYHEDGNYILFEYKKFGTSAAFQEAWNKTGDVAVEKQVSKWVSDSRRMAVLSPADQKWFAEDWSMRIQEAIQKNTFTAIVLDKGAFAEMSAKSIASETGGDRSNGVVLTYEFFKDIDAAQDWIKNLENQLEPLAR
jgi:hypothetical protein